LKIIISILITMTTASVFAFPTAPFNALDQSELKTINSPEALQYNFEGIIKLSNCSGSLIAFHGQPLTSKAVIMTNGHCIQKPGGGFLAPGEVWLNRPISRVMKIFDKNMKLRPVEATKILYATMTNTDLAFYELSESYAEILSRTGVNPFLLDSVRPLNGSSIDIISGYWDRGYSCEIDGFVFNIKEGAWLFTDSIRYTSGCDTIGGTSGSPIIARGERRVIAINNTSNESGQLCTINNPCEVDEEGEVTVRKGVRYGQQTYQTYGCLTPDFNFELSRAGCELPQF
jgi:V8-like Glu-specific endopeptidase